MKIEAAVREYLIEIEVRKYTPRTIKGYRTNLNLFLRFCKEKAMIEDAEDISLGVVKQLTKLLTDQGKKGTYVNTILKTVKSFIQYCYEEGYGGFNTKKNFKWCKEEKCFNEPVIPGTVVTKKVSNSGQDCTDYIRIYVHESLYERYLELVAKNREPQRASFGIVFNNTAGGYKIRHISQS